MVDNRLPRAYTLTIICQDNQGNIACKREGIEMDNSNQKVFVVYNPKAGDEDQADELRSTLSQHFTGPQWSLEIHETTAEEDVTAVCRAACDRGLSLLVSAGGDGTLMYVANALVGRSIPLGVIPMGTGNLLAKVLGIPSKLDEAVKLLSGDHTMIEIDTLKVGERHFLSNVSVGISPIIMRDTSSKQKKHLGMLAYFLTMVKRSRLFNLRQYILTIDGKSRRVRAAEIFISNIPFLEKATELYGPPDTLSDGQFELYLAEAQTAGDYLRLLWDLIRSPNQRGSKVFHWVSQKNVRIEAVGMPQRVQGDGEVIGHTPVEVQLVPKSIQVIMPPPSTK
jgi:YegS/Rv2252/BmrU family lipid kinase